MSTETRTVLADTEPLCPVCGHAAAILHHDEGFPGPDWYRVECINCQANDGEHRHSAEEALHAWGDLDKRLRRATRQEVKR